MKSIAEALSVVTDASEMEQFLSELFTEKELESLDLRWRLMHDLKEGMTQRAIASELHISLCKVTRGNKIVKDESSVTYRLLDE